MAQEKSLVIVDSDEKSRGALAKIARSIAGVKLEAETGDFALGMKLARQTRPDVLLVEVSPFEEAIDEIDRFHGEQPGTAIIATAKDASAESVLKSMRAGAKEFLSRPIQDEEARQAIDRLLRQLGADRSAGSRVISVFSNKGGTGTTTIAVNLAVSLAKVTGQGVALADFDLNAGEASLYLNLKPIKTVAHLASEQTKLDAAAVQSALVKHASGVYVLCEPERPEQAEGMPPVKIRQILKILASAFPYVVCDLTHSFQDTSLEVFDNSSNILVATLLNLPAIRSSHRCLEVFRQLNYLRDESKVRVLVNRYLPNRDIDVAQLEETLRYPVYWKIPNDYPTVIDAVNSGMPIDEVNPESEVARSFMALAADLAGVDVALTANSKSSSGLLGKLLGRKP